MRLPRVRLVVGRLDQVVRCGWVCLFKVLLDNHYRIFFSHREHRDHREQINLFFAHSGLVASATSERTLLHFFYLCPLCSLWQNRLQM